MSTNGKKGLGIWIPALLVIAALGAGAFFLFRDTEVPVISIGPDTATVGAKTRYTVTTQDMGLGLKWVKIYAVQGDKQALLVDKALPKGTAALEETVTLDKADIKEGAFSIRVEARDNSLYPFGDAGLATVSRDFLLDATPPRIYVQTHTNNLNQGGAGLLAFTLSETATRAGIRVGERWFPAYLQQGASQQNLYYCMFTIPWDTPPSKFAPMIEAEDAAGNMTSRSFNFHANARSFRKDRIGLSDRFMERTIPEFQAQLKGVGGSLLDQYLFINNTIRTQNRAKLLELGRKTSPTFLWKGTFVRLPNAANRARFADARDYMYKGKKVDHQTHLGLDLASLRNAPVPSANSGTVVWADFLGIYGNCVVVDHGLGLQTLYAHLTSMSVKAEDTVTKGQIIGHTGTTGLAGGDHLHYGVIISGIPVQPIEWWDAAWIRNNITSKLN
ncbi:M23 family metallopeptidase [Pseudodesulfovibrio tunisiensis]|uniref:M23 family metallopeptidase n=1 Tax=Pseudodesulfovibrio tunisiensis TaxID=463192 RepID=UPI001FB367CA|nr:M23 family metallopeptidase [Pseudodesulfovibrio tunisiensis]